MECPNCQKELSASDHCLYCGWKAEPLANNQDEGKPEVSALSAGEPANALAPAPAPPQAPSNPAEPAPIEPPPPLQPAAPAESTQEPAEPGAQTPAETVEREDPVAAKESETPKQSQSREDPQPVLSRENPQPQGKPRPGKKNVQAQINKVNGPDNIIAQTCNVYHGKETHQETAAYLSIAEATVRLPPNSSDLPEVTFDDHAYYLQKLNAERLILISCADQDLAYTAAHALIGKLEINSDERKRLVNFDRITEEQLAIYSLLSKKTSSKYPTAIVVDAFSDKAGTFVDSLFKAGLGPSGNIKEELMRAQLFIICVLAPEEVETRVKSYRDQLRFTYWELPFLQLLLSCYQPAEAVAELRRTLLEQQRRGSWSGDNNEFARQIKAALKSNRLSEVIAQHAETPEPLNASALPKEDDPLTRLILYVATYFPGLSPSEFNRVMDALLGDLTETFTTTSNKTDTEGKTVVVETQVERKIRQRWELSRDNLLKSCQLVTNKNSSRMIAFSDDRLSQRQKEIFEEEHGLYLETEFRTLQQSGLLFDVSEKVAEHGMRLVLEMMLVYPGDYGRDWLVPFVTGILGKLIAPGNETLSQPNRTVQFLKESWGDRYLRQFYVRLSQLLRKMLKYPDLVETVDALLEQLIVARYFGAAPEIARELRFAPAFDEFYWIKQVVDRGDEAARIKAHAYLYGEIKKDQRVYEVLRALEAWLPDPERDLDNFSISNNFALQVLLDYCLETTFRFEAKDYGAWRKHSLLAARSPEDAEKNFDLLR